MAKVAKSTILAYAALTAMKAADLFDRLSDKVKVSKAIETAKEKFVDNLKEFAKEIAAAKRLYTERIEDKSIPGDTSFKKYFKDNTKGELPPRAEALASLFNALVLTLDGNGKPLLPEEYFDAAAVDWLEKASAIVNAARKKHGENWKTCDEVLDTINALSKPGDAAKALKEIRATQKGEKKDGGGDGAKSAVAITPQLAAEYLIAAIKQAATKTAEEQYSLFVLSTQVGDSWAESGLSDDVLNAMSEQLDAANRHGVAPHIQVRTETEAVAA